MAHPKATTEQISLRVPEEWLVRADVIAEVIAPDAGPTFSRTDVFRAALGHGLRELERLGQITLVREKNCKKRRPVLPSGA